MQLPIKSTVKNFTRKKPSISENVLDTKSFFKRKVECTDNFTCIDKSMRKSKQWQGEIMANSMGTFFWATE